MNPETVRKVGAVIFGVVIGLGLGVGAYTLLYAKGWAYLTNDPAACANCHVMSEHFGAWMKGSHHAVATCVACHLPHGLIGKYIAKAENGYHHSKAFTLQNFHEPIVITPKASRILQNNCLACHAGLVHEQVVRADTSGEVQCVHCHRSVGHGAMAGLGRRIDEDSKGVSP